MANFDDTGASWKSISDIDAIARSIRNALGLSMLEAAPPVVELVSKIGEIVPHLNGLIITPQTEHQLGRAKAYAKAKHNEIVTSEDLLLASMDDEPTARFEIVHELGHLLLKHRGQDKFFLVAEGNVTYPFLRDEERVEWQADQFSMALLMTPKMVESASSARELAKHARVPIEWAVKRWRQARTSAKPPLDQRTLNEIAELRTAAASDLVKQNRFEFESKKLKLWGELPVVPGESPTTWRQCGKFQIRWSDFGMRTGCGWYIENGTIRAYIDEHDA